MKHFAEAVEKSLTSGNSYAALVVAMTLPDICGWVGGVDAQSKARYLAFFNSYMSDLYAHPVDLERAPTVFLTGEDFYALRCALVHEGREDITTQKARQTLDKFQFVVPPPTWAVHRNLVGTGQLQLQLQVDVFCREILSGVYAFLDSIEPGSDASARLTMLGRIYDIDGVPL